MHSWERCGKSRFWRLALRPSDSFNQNFLDPIALEDLSSLTWPKDLTVKWARVDKLTERLFNSLGEYAGEDKKRDFLEWIGRLVMGDTEDEGFKERLRTELDQDPLQRSIVMGAVGNALLYGKPPEVAQKTLVMPRKKKLLKQVLREFGLENC